MQYSPQPIDVTAIKLDEPVQSLIEKLAKNTHDIWAFQRMEDGWTLGKERDDTNKKHPCLVDYEKLPEDEKEYDRKVSEGIIKTMLKMGYSVHPPEKLYNYQDNGLEAISASLSNNNLNISQLLEIWKKYNSAIWAQHPELCRQLGERVLRSGEPLLAYDILSTGLEILDDTILLEPRIDPSRRTYIKLQQQRALALAQSGAPQKASFILQQILSHDVDDGETAGLYGRTCKDIAFAESNSVRRREKFHEAFNIYHRAYLSALKDSQIDDAYYNGINAATLALFSRDLPRSLSLASRVQELCLEKLKALENRQSKVSYWLYATLGEAELLLGKRKQAAAWYQKAAKETHGNIRDLASMHKQAKAILTAMGIEENLLNSCFNVPTVVAFTGHMIDQLGRLTKRFPAEVENQVRQEIAKKLNEVNAGIAYASAACGADIIFLEEMLNRGGEINIVLPFEENKFIEESVNVTPNGHWKDRFENVMKQATKVHVLGEYNGQIANQNHFEFANLFLYGAAVTRSQMLSTNLLALAVWDGQTEGLPGGTAATVQRWRDMPHDFFSINPSEHSVKAARPRQTDNMKNDTTEDVTHHTYLPLLFADVKGYSKLTEQQTVDFSVHFLGHISKIISQFEDRIISKRTQGDGLFLVFKDLAAAVQLASEINVQTSSIDWSQFGLPKNLLFRISLDAGPCYTYTDKIVNKKEFCGAYVVRAARMEPITPPGEIYASETFVALAHATNLEKVHFDYAGLVTLPKGYGIMPAFHVRQ